MTPTNDNAALLAAYEQGWHECAQWAKRDDLHADTDSPAYERARDARLAKIATRPAVDTPDALPDIACPDGTIIPGWIVANMASIAAWFKANSRDDNWHVGGIGPLNRKDGCDANTTPPPAPDAVPSGQGVGEDSVVREDAPPSSLPTWDECSLRVENSNRAAARRSAGGLGEVEDVPYANDLHRFIYEYDDADVYKSAWFMHRLELALAAAGVSGVNTEEVLRLADRLDRWGDPKYAPMYKGDAETWRGAAQMIRTLVPHALQAALTPGAERDGGEAR